MNLLRVDMTKMIYLKQSEISSYNKALGRADLFLFLFFNYS